MPSSSSSLDALNKVWEVCPLKKMPNPEKATQYLNNLVKATANIMLKRKWKVKVLKEFYPTNDNLLGMNVNRGASICIRLRSPHDRNVFLEWHDILGTMCHELAHMVISPHNAEFYKLWDQIADEVAMESSGMIGFGNRANNGTSSSSSVIPFSGNSTALGGGKVVPRERMSEVAAQAAIKRQKLSTNSSGSGQKLGGIHSGKHLSPTELARLAAIAAERRIIDDKWCPTQSEEIGSPLNSQVNAETNWICNACLEPNNDTVRQCSFCGNDKDYNVVGVAETVAVDLSNDLSFVCPPCQNDRSSSSGSSKAATSQPMASTNIQNIDTIFERVCPICTFVNTDPQSTKCVICDGQLVKDEAKWTCPRCTLVNDTTNTCCGACQYSKLRKSNEIVVEID